MKQITDTFAKIVMTLLSIFGGMFTGALIIYFLSEIIQLAVYGSGPVENSYFNCDRRNAIGSLSIFGGGLLGIVPGSFGALNYLKSFRRENAETGVEPIVQSGAHDESSAE